LESIKAALFLNDFFPRTYWRHLPKGRNYALGPDTLMITDIRGKRRAFVLGAKRYRYRNSWGLGGEPEFVGEACF
jgi:hypothetical protein